MNETATAIQILFAALTGIYIAEKGWGFKEILIINIGFAIMLRLALGLCN